MLRATNEEIEDVKLYFTSQAPDLEITFVQKVYSEAIYGHTHDVWDIHTNVDRWWVITNPTNLYSQEHFPNMDLAVTFHMGLCLRVPRSQKKEPSVRRTRPFGEIAHGMGLLSEALGQSHNISDFQAMGMRCRELLLAFVKVAQDEESWTDAPLKQADFRGWNELMFNVVLPGSPQKERRRLMKSLADECWTFANWLTHAKSATWHDAEAAASTVQHFLGLAISLMIRYFREVPDQCLSCGSPNLSPWVGIREDLPDIEWERPVCRDCGWQGTPVPVGERVDIDDDDEEPLFIREGGADTDECIIASVPLRTLKKPERG